MDFGTVQLSNNNRGIANQSRSMDIVHDRSKSESPRTTPSPSRYTESMDIKSGEEEKELQRVRGSYDIEQGGHNKPTHHHQVKIHGEQRWCTQNKRSVWTGDFLPSSALRDHPDYSICKESYCGLLRGSVRQDWNTIESKVEQEENWEELKARWFELFFDLMFVAAIIHISTECAYAYKAGSYMFIYTVFCQFGLLVLCWLEQALFESRFRMNQTWDGFCRFCYMALILLMGLSMSYSGNQTPQKLFLGFYGLTKFITFLMFLKATLIARARNHAIYMMMENIVTIITVICILILIDIEDEDYKYDQWQYAVIYASFFVYSWIHNVVMVYSKCIRDLGVNIPINVPHIAERMGALVLVILGETIICIMTQTVESNSLAIITSYTVTFSFFIIVYCIGKLYFESQPTEHDIHHHRKVHAMSASVWRARIYKWFHILLFFGLLGLGLGAKITVYNLSYYDESKPFYVMLPGISCIVILICINIIRLTHPFDYNQKNSNMVIGVWVMRAFCIALMICLLFAWNLINHAIILFLYVLCFLAQILLDFEAKHRYFADKDDHHGHHHHAHYQSPKEALQTVDTPDSILKLAVNALDADNQQNDDVSTPFFKLPRGASRKLSYFGAC